MRASRLCTELLLALCPLAMSCTSLLGDDFNISTGTSGGGTGGGASCQPGCAGADTRRECGPAGEVIDTPCPVEAPWCTNGVCGQDCADNARDCLGSDVRECSGGQWSVVQSCTVGCDAGACLTVVDVAAGLAHTCAALSDGTVRCWGNSALERLEEVFITDAPAQGSYATVPTAIPGISNALAVAAGGMHSCARTADLGVVCWGWNGMGQLGTGDFVASASAEAVTLDTTATDLAAGYGHACISGGNGSVVCWGSNEQGQLGNGQMQAGQFLPTPQSMSLPSPAQTISSKNNHTCSLTTSGAAFCWGQDNFGQLATGSEQDVPSPVEFLANYGQEVRAGFRHSCARSADTVLCAGSNSDGQLGTGAANGDNVQTVVAEALGPMSRLELGGMHSCGLDAQQALWCWGADAFGQVGDGQSGAAMAVTQPYQVPIAAVIDVAAGYLHTCALTVDGTLYCWGLNNRGQLGTGDTTDSAVPLPVVWH